MRKGLEECLSSFLLMFMRTASIYPQSGAKELFEIYFWNNCAFVFVVKVKKGIFRVVTLSINKAFIKTILTFWPFNYKAPIRAGSLCSKEYPYEHFG